jgi:hypothetical protein
MALYLIPNASCFLEPGADEATSLLAHNQVKLLAGAVIG